MELWMIPIIIVLAIIIRHKYLTWREKRILSVRQRRRTGYGYIYFYRGAGENPFQVKIGRAKDWKQRLKSSRTSVGAKGFHIYGIVLVKSDVWAEGYIHARFADNRYSKSNEWFRLTPELYLYIRRVRDDKLTKQARMELAIDA